MFTKSIFAISGAMLTAVAAIPMADSHHHHHHPQYKRDYFWVTKTEEVIQTVAMTKTVWVEPGETVPTPSSSFEDVKPAAYHPASSPKAPAAYSAPAYNSPAESEPQSTYVAPVPTSTYVAPASPAYSAPAAPVYSAPTTSVYVAPTPTSTYVAPAPYVAPTTSAAPAPAAYTPASGSSDSGSGGSGVTGMAASGKTYTGDLTYYAVGMGSCGKTSTEDEKIVALSHEIMSVYDGANPNNNPLCGRFITITGTDGNKYRAEIVDTCPGCDVGSLDLPQAYFNKITGNGDGRVSGIKWSFD